MNVKRAIAFVVCGFFSAGAALATPIVVKDDTGRTYQLNDDGTYDTVVKSEDGRTFLLAPDGTWRAPDEDASLQKKFLDWLDEARKGGDGPKVADADWPKYRQCLLGTFDALPHDGKRLLLSGSDPQDGYGKLEKKYPAEAKGLDEGDRNCRRNLETPN